MEEKPSKEIQTISEKWEKESALVAMHLCFFSLFFIFCAMRYYNKTAANRSNGMEWIFFSFSRTPLSLLYILHGLFCYSEAESSLCWFVASIHYFLDIT